MAQPDALAYAFLASHPAAAARVLEAMPVAEAAALFRDVPARVGGAVLAALGSATAARIVAALERQTALSLLAAAGTHAVIGVLRHTPEPQASALIEGLPTATALASRLLLGYPEDSAAAWADPDFIALPPEASVGEAMARLRDPDAPLVRVLYLTARDGRIGGVASLHALLRAPAATPLSALARSAPATVPAAAPLASVADHPGWRSAATLPVVEPGERLIGVLARAAVLDALAQRRAPAEGMQPGLGGALAGGYWGAISALVNAFVALLPPPRRVLPEKR